MTTRTTLATGPASGRGIVIGGKRCEKCCVTFLFNFLQIFLQIFRKKNLHEEYKFLCMGQLALRENHTRHWLDKGLSLQCTSHANGAWRFPVPTSSYPSITGKCSCLGLACSIWRPVAALHILSGGSVVSFPYENPTRPSNRYKRYSRAMKHEKE